MGTLYMKNISFPKVLGRKTIDILMGSGHPELKLALTESYGSFGAPEARKMPLGLTCDRLLPHPPFFSRNMFVLFIGELPQEARCCETLQRKKLMPMSRRATFGSYKLTRQAEAEDGPSWYLLHFPVIREDSETTKVCIVFDSPARCNCVSVNDAVLTGSKLQRVVLEIFLPFRLKPVALVADIEN